MKIVSGCGIELVILDPELSRITLYKLFKKRTGLTSMPPILVYSDDDEQVFADTYIRMGAAGYLEQKCRPDQMIKTIGVRLKGNIYLSEEAWG